MSEDPGSRRLKAFGAVFALGALLLLVFTLMAPDTRRAPAVPEDVQPAETVPEGPRPADEKEAPIPHVVPEAGETPVPMALQALRKGVADFHAAKQRWPESLEELKSEGFVSDIPPGAAYDPASGSVSLPQE